MKGVTLLDSVNRPMLFYALKSEAACPFITVILFCHSDFSKIPEESNAGMVLKV
jgi:hypothetical protein